MPLRYEGTRYILLELPFVPFKNWMTEEIDNIAYRFSLTPVLAHLDRYDWYSRDEVEELLERDDTVYQFNCSAFAERGGGEDGAPLDQGGTASAAGQRRPQPGQAPAALCGEGEGPAFQAEGGTTRTLSGAATPCWRMPSAEERGTIPTCRIPRKGHRGCCWQPLFMDRLCVRPSLLPRPCFLQ